MSHRKIHFLNKNRIIYKRDPLNDTPTEIFNWGYFYEQGTYECYNLFNTKSKINTYKSLKWHLLVLWYLNPQLGEKEFSKLSKIIANKTNGFVTFTLTKNKIKEIIKDINLIDLEKPPRNKLRKIIFKDNSGLTNIEKLKIVGKLLGRNKKVHEQDIYEHMIDLHEDGENITIRRIAELLECSSKTIHRNMSKELKQEKINLNKKLNEKI
tara:strand:+ start:1898 stop:2527 length:630 start_codon:yes stop_codon:yes gene_type:complete